MDPPAAAAAAPSKHPVDELFDFALEKWYPLLRDYTFESEWLPLSWEEVDAMRKSRDSVQIRGGRIHRLSDLSPQVNAILQQLSTRIDKVLQRLGPCFVKLNTRSPKDSCYDIENAELCADLQATLLNFYSSPRGSRLLTGVENDQSELEKELTNEEIRIFFTCANNRMCVSSGNDALSIFLLSDRISEDLRHTQTYRESDSSTPCPAKLVLRKWLPLPLESEFRTFVSQGRLTAVSQYYHFIYFPDLVNNKDKIFEQIKQAFDSIKHLIPYPSYCIDFALLDDKPRVIELNPFGDRTGACNFSWKKGPAERKVLLEGPLEFRVTESFFNNARERFLVSFYDNFMSQVRANVLMKRLQRRRMTTWSFLSAAVVVVVGGVVFELYRRGNMLKK